MKYPALLPFSQVLPEIGQYDTIIDVRTPAEYAEDHIPGAINCPVLDNDERVRIGTLYKQTGPFEAKKAGAALVAKNIAYHLEHTFADMPREWRPLVYCWRGGNRSGSMAHILAKIGWPAVQVEGGYKAYRQEVNLGMPELVAPFEFRVVCGTTGSGKSRLLEAMHGEGMQVLDLEQLAAHRGSVLGPLPGTPQPTQKAFESRIWNALRGFDPARPVYIESESKKVGSVRVPDALIAKMRASRCIALDTPRELRLQLLMEDYAHFVRDAASLNEQLSYLTSLYGHDKIQAWQALANSGDMRTLVDQLLAEHYDPAYLRSIARNFARYGEAQVLTLGGIDHAALVRAAQRLA
ncbi:MAG TPA: tRNA 2-selenouridine(34) synthase MnmH [Burkholderiaceae bacterium]